MGASASVIQEYYKAVDYWADIAEKKTGNWRYGLSEGTMWTWWTSSWR